jgi:nicotinamide-nucleotide amidase
MLTERTTHLAETLLEACKAQGVMIAAAESCTGGMLGACLTHPAGASAMVERVFVTYTDTAKAEMLGVHAQTLQSHGAVSEAVAKAMAEGALRHSQAHIAVSITGVAGPGGGTAEKPVGLVHFGIAKTGEGVHHVMHTYEDSTRHDIRVNAVETALDLLCRASNPGEQTP